MTEDLDAAKALPVMRHKIRELLDLSGLTVITAGLICSRLACSLQKVGSPAVEGVTQHRLCDPEPPLWLK